MAAMMRDRGNVPAETTSFVGRHREIADLQRLVGAFRLVTVSGAGGVGKTRLALRVAAHLPAATRHQVRFVDLNAVTDLPLGTADVPDPQSVARLVITALGIREVSTDLPVQLLTRYLARRRMVLVLDSCEVALSACAELANALVRACPRLRILAISRELLAVYGEARFVVEPLPVPDLQRLPAAPAQLMGWESVALFVARAADAVPGFALTETNFRAVAGICHRLEGLPLAIELAAARLRTLTPQQVLSQLVDRFSPLGPPQPGALDRHRTLRACIDWSFDLCSAPEQRLWARLTVFAGPFEFDAVEGICTDGLAGVDLLDLVSGLIDQSILTCVDEGGSQVRYRMLGLVRDYGREKLREAGEEDRLRRRHLDWHQQLVARASDDLISVRQSYWLDRLTRDYPDLRAAVEYGLTRSGQAEESLRLVVGLPTLYWWARGLFGEGRRWLDLALARTTGRSALRARALLLAGYLAVWQGDADTGMRQLEEGEHLARSLADPTLVAFALYTRGVIAGSRNDLAGAMATLERALPLATDQSGAGLELRLAVLLVLGMDAALIGDQQRARASYEEIVEITEPRQGSYFRSYALWALGLEAWRQGRFDEATEKVTAGLRIKREKLSVDQYGMVLCLEVLAWIAVGRHRHRRAAVLLGAADTLWAEIGLPVSSHGHLVGYHDDCERQVRDALGVPGYAAAFRHGQTLSYDDALRYAVDQQLTPTSGPAGR